MACALRLSQLIDAHNAKNPDSQLSKENIYVLEKAREIGQHSLSGALLDPRSMRELLPGFEKEAPLDAEVTKEAVYFFTEKSKFKLPDHASAFARPRQLRHLAQSIRKVAGRQGGGDRYHRSSPALPVPSFFTMVTASPVSAPTIKAWTSRTSRNRTSNLATICKPKSSSSPRGRADR